MDMDGNVRPESKRRINIEALREPRMLASVAFIAGLAIGLLVLGWWLFPVQWENATPLELRLDIQEDYLRMVIDSYNLRQDDLLAENRLTALGDSVQELLASVAASPGDQSSETISRFQVQLGVVDALSSSGLIGQDGESVGEDSSLLDSRSLFLTMVSITVVLGVALGVIYYVRRRQSGGKDRPAILQAREFTRGTEQSDFSAQGESQPLSQWMTTYVLGDDLFDDSFSIDSSTGEFLGECGVGIAETIGVGDPKRVSAFEIWLFDKNDIQTVTKVLMSNHTFQDDSVRDRLSAKGEPILANSGVEAVLETETLQMVARVVDMDYGEGALPEESFFERATLELAVWSKI